MGKDELVAEHDSTTSAECAHQTDIYWQTGLGCAYMPYLTIYVARHAAAAAVDVVDVIVSVIGAVISRLPESRAVRLDVRLGTYY